MPPIWLANALEQIDSWLDSQVTEEYKIQPLAQDWARIAKLSEELGEAIQAWIGYTGQNPRKGYTHTLDQVLDELADCILTAYCGIQHFTKDGDKTTKLVEARIFRVMERAGLA